MLTENDLKRYERQILHASLGKKGQEKLKQSHVVVAGLGGLGCAASLYLTCSGVGHVTLIDGDRVELSNLNRQVLHYEEDIGEGKPFSVARKLAKLNSSIEVTPVSKKITERNAREIVKGQNRDGGSSLEAGNGEGIEVGGRGIRCRRRLSGCTEGSLLDSLTAPPHQGPQPGEDHPGQHRDADHGTDASLVVAQPGEDAGKRIHSRSPAPGRW